jgi:predicted amidohydrolase
MLPTELIKQSADLVLMPHSAPDMSGSGGLPQPPGTRLALWYAKKLGIPVAMVNKVGRSYKPPPNEINGFFPGLSAIVDSDGTVRQSMDDKEGVGIADVTLDPSRKKNCQRRTCLYLCGDRRVDDRGRGRKRGSREVPGFRQRVLRLQPYTQSQGACDFRQALNSFPLIHL